MDFKKNDSSSSSVLLFGSSDLTGESGSGSSDSAGGSECYLSSFYNCYWSAILFCSLSTGKSLSETAWEVFVIQPDFFRAIAVMVWVIAWSPLCQPFLSVWGTSEVDDGWMWLPSLYESMALEDSVVGRFDVKNAEFHDNVVWIRSNGERDCSRRAQLALVKYIEKRLGLRENHLLSPLF